MKRIILVLAVLIILVSALPAVSVRAGLGVFSSAGIGFEPGPWNFNLELRSAFPVVSLAASGMVSGYINRASFGFCSGLYNGAGLGVFYRLLDTRSHRLSLGLDVSAGLVLDGKEEFDLISKYEKGILALLSLQMEYSFRIDSHNGLFFSCGYPAVTLMHLFGVPGDDDAYSIDAWMLFPKSFIELEKNQDIPGVTKLAALLLVGATVRVGYAYTF